MLYAHLKTGEPVRIYSRMNAEGGMDYFYLSELLLRVQAGENLLEREKELYNRSMRAFFNLNVLEIRGDALREIPHGFVCIHGSRKNMRKLVTGATNTVRLIKFGCLDNLEERLQETFGVEQRLDYGGLLRLQFLYTHLKLPPQHYILILREGENKVTIPGGKRHLGEQSRECAERELFEETGLKLSLKSDPVYCEPCRANYYTLEC